MKTKYTKYITLLLITLFLFIPQINAKKCDKEDIARLKNLAEHVDVSYKQIEEYTIDNGDIEPITYKDKYIVSISNMTEEIYVEMKDELNITINFDNNESISKKEYIDPGKKTIAIYSTNCKTKLRTIKINLPYFNLYSESEECKKIDNKIEVCKKWTSKKISEKRFQNEIQKYTTEKEINKDRNKIITFIMNNLIYVIGSIMIIILITIIILIIKKKKNELK